MGSFISEHILSIFFALALLWMAKVVMTKQKYKKKGVALTGTVVANRTVTSSQFPVFEFCYEGETLRIDSYEGSKTGLQVGTEETIYYMPGNKDGVFREADLKIKPWMLLVSVFAVIYIVADFTMLHK